MGSVGAEVLAEDVGLAAVFLGLVEVELDAAAEGLPEVAGEGGLDAGGGGFAVEDDGAAEAVALVEELFGLEEEASVVVFLPAALAHLEFDFEEHVVFEVEDGAEDVALGEGGGGDAGDAAVFGFGGVGEFEALEDFEEVFGDEAPADVEGGADEFVFVVEGLGAEGGGGSEGCGQEQEDGGSGGDREAWWRGQGEGRGGVRRRGRGFR